MKTIDIIIPLYNEEELVEELISRLQKITERLPHQFSFIVVDDGSNDRTLEILLSLQKGESRLKIIRLSRNWGHQNAYNAGLDMACGDASILMDGDLEDPPELIAEFIEKWDDGFEVVCGTKISRQRSYLERLLFSLFHLLLVRFSNVKIEKNAGMFSLLDKKVREHLKKCRETNKYYAGLRSYLGFKQIAIPYHRSKRFAGIPKQTFLKLANDGLNALFSFSFLPIRILTYFGFFMLILIFFAGVALIVGFYFDIPIAFFQGLKQVPGWSSLVLLILSLLGIQIIFMGILGEYIARIFDEVRNRPYYIIDRVFDPNQK